MSRTSLVRSIARRVQKTLESSHSLSLSFGENSLVLAHYATKSAATSVKLPPQFGIPGRYAAALYMASAKQGRCVIHPSRSRTGFRPHETSIRCSPVLTHARTRPFFCSLSNVEKEVPPLLSVLSSSPDLKTFVGEPGMPAKTRAAGLNAVLDKVGVKDSTIKRFVDVVVENKRTSDLEGMLRKFEEIASQQRGEVKATVTTATALGKGDLEKVKGGLSGLLGKGESLHLEERVDPSIISGIVIDMGGRHVGMSVSTRVKKLQTLIRNA